MKIVVGGRASPLSQAQIKEIHQLLQAHGCPLEFDLNLVKTTGDLDLKKSLRTLGKTDFFTKEVDDLLLKGACRIAIHSAKDLPENIAEGLKIAAITKGIDPRDSLVLAPGQTLASLPSQSKIATSSERREEIVKQMRPDLQFVDIRGTIEARLAKIASGEVAGIVVAEAALIRLGLMHLNRIPMPGKTVEGQGQLAILVRAGDEEMRDLFAPLDSRCSLCLGLNVPKKFQNRLSAHHPIIAIEQREDPSLQQIFAQLALYTHLLFTSKTAVSLFFKKMGPHGFQKHHLIDKKIIAIGQATAMAVHEYGFHVDLVADEEDTEGLIQKLETLNLDNSYFLWPHSALSRELLPAYFLRKQIRWQEAILYTTKANINFAKPDLKQFGEIIFTSPSTVQAFVQQYGQLPQEKWLRPIGRVTRQALVDAIQSF